jgi:hypothetical protein
MGKVKSPVQEPMGDAGETIGNTQLGIGTVDPTVFEMVLAPGGFDTDAGEQKNARDKTKLRFFFDRGGNAMVRFEGSVNLRFKKKLRIVIDDDCTIIAKKNVSLSCDGDLSLFGKTSASVGSENGVTAFSGGTKPIATVGSTVRVTILPGTLAIVGAADPATHVVSGFVTGAVLDGTVQTGVPTLLG